eukprot:m.50785 g.50785  ORF g.50785 m.50785 type:complete len:283 (+) comp10688_c0_seq6:1349-2197(+)
MLVVGIAVFTVAEERTTNGTTSIKEQAKKILKLLGPDDEPEEAVVVKETVQPIQQTAGNLLDLNDVSESVAPPADTSGSMFSGMVVASEETNDSSQIPGSLFSGMQVESSAETQPSNASTPVSGGGLFAGMNMGGTQAVETTEPSPADAKPTNDPFDLSGLLSSSQPTPSSVTVDSTQNTGGDINLIGDSVSEPNFDPLSFGSNSAPPNIVQPASGVPSQNLNTSLSPAMATSPTGSSNPMGASYSNLGMTNTGMYRFHRFLLSFNCIYDLLRACFWPATTI